MSDLRSIHSITVSMHEGMYILAVTAVIVRLLTIIVPKLPVLGWFISERPIRKIAQYSEIVAFIAALGGTIGIVASAISGTVLYTPSAVPQSPLVLNKIAMTVFSLVLWLDFLVIRLKYGDEKIWTNSVLRVFYSSIGLGGFLFTVLAGSLGGTLAGMETVIEPLYQIFGAHKSELWVIPPIAAFSRMVVNSPLQQLVNASLMFRMVILTNFVIIILVAVYVSFSTSSSGTS